MADVWHPASPIIGGIGPKTSWIAVLVVSSAWLALAHALADMYVWGESPWICQKDISLVLSFAVSRHLCRVNLTLSRGNIVQEVCQRLFNEERIPVYLQSNLMDAVLRTVYEDHLSQVLPSEDVLDVGLMIEQARLLSRQFDVTTTVSKDLAQSFVTSYGPVDITWSLKPNPSFAAELGRPSSPPPRSSSPSGSSSFSTLNRSTTSPFVDTLDAKKFISSSVARGSRTPQESLQLAKMYLFLVAGDHSVTPSHLSLESLSSSSSSASLIDGDLHSSSAVSSAQVLAPEIVKLQAPVQAVGGIRPSNTTSTVRKQLFRKRKQAGGAELLLLLQDTTNEFRDMIAELERSLSASMGQLMQAREVAIATLSERQAREMERASQGSSPSPSMLGGVGAGLVGGVSSFFGGGGGGGSSEGITQLVERHMLEMEGLEAKWQVELAEARKRQRREYYAFCSDLYKNRERYLEDKRAMGPQQVAQLRQQHAQSQMNASSQSSKRFLSGGWTSLIFGKSSTNLATGSGNSGNNEQGKVIRLAGNNSSLLMAREMTHSDQGTYSIVVMLGSQLKVPFEVQVYGGGGMLSIGNIGNVASLTPTSSSHLISGDPNSDSIYSSSLTAMVLMADPSMSCNSPTYADFFALTSHSTELHFESAQDQIDTVRSQVPVSKPADIMQSSLSKGTTSNASKLEPGDFFVTTHSNLGKVQVVFHMVGERQNIDNSWQQLLAGLKNILTIASHYDVTTLSLPILLIEPEFRHLHSDGMGIKRAEEVIRTIRSFLVLNSASGTSLKTIRLVVPPQSSASQISSASSAPSSPQEDQARAADSQYFERVKSIVSTLFNQPLH